MLALLVATTGVTGALGVYLAEQGVFDAVEADPDRRATPVRAIAYVPGQAIRSVAVLPLDDFSPDGNQAYFAAGMHEELIAKLSILDGIRVVSRRSVMQYAQTTLSMPDIGRELDVDVVVEGSVTRTGDRTRVTLHVVHAPSESDIQTLQWDRAEVSDVLAFQTEVAHALVHEIDGAHEETVFTRTAANVMPAAQDAYFKGKYEYERGTPDGYRSAFDYFEEALVEDPDFAPAMAGMAGARFLIGLEDPEDSGHEFSQAHEEAVAALDLDSTSVEAMEVLAFIERSMPHVMGTEPEIPGPLGAPKTMRVVSIPGGSDSIMIDVAAFDTTWVSAVTALGERIEEQVRRRRISPERDGDPRGALEVRQLMSTGRYAEAATVLDEIVSGSPGTSAAWEMLVRANVSAGDEREAVAAVRRWHESAAPGAPNEVELSQLTSAVARDGAEGYWAWTLDRLTAADAAGRAVPRADLAAAHAALGHRDEAFGYLFQALEAGEPGVLSIRSDPVWDDLRNDDRFREAGRQAQMMRFSPIRRAPGARPPRG
ncbi:MAG: hypothetical protein O2958_00990 [Gemmatimonadetes bacterium]|nr:hypothetical protein [Gemmatimonadota bacterium]